MDNVVGLDRQPIEYDAQSKIVEILEEYLAMAKAGHVTSIFVAGSHVNGDSMDRAWWPVRGGVRLLGVVDLAHANLRESLRGKE